jgi:hypothetical protein
MLRVLSLAALISTTALAVETQDRWSTFWDDEEMIARIRPAIKVQASLAEGLGWEGTGSAMQNANHVVIAISGSDAKVKSPIPYAKRPVVVKAASDLACIVEDGENHFKDCSMSSSKEYLFTTNALGRVSFSIPIEDQLKKHLTGSLFPTLLIQTDYMDDDEW